VAEVTQAHHALHNVTKEWQTTSAPTLYDRRPFAARDLVAPIDRLVAVLPVGVAPADEPLREKLAILRQGADMLASLPLDQVGLRDGFGNRSRLCSRVTTTSGLVGRVGLEPTTKGL
jgi:hypothetical protein